MAAQRRLNRCGPKFVFGERNNYNCHTPGGFEDNEYQKAQCLHADSTHRQKLGGGESIQTCLSHGSRAQRRDAAVAQAADEILPAKIDGVVEGKAWEVVPAVCHDSRIVYIRSRIALRITWNN
eukprot:scaffold28301_cov32-Prasinocladus_malaysianus.AAC.2